jgi:hypothetical protein
LVALLVFQSYGDILRMLMVAFIKKIKYKLFPFLELEHKNLSFGKKIYIWFNTLGVFSLYSYIFLYFFSYTFYSYKWENKNIKLYTNTNITYDKKFQFIMKNIETDLANMDIYFKGYKVKIYMVDNSFIYAAHSFFMNITALNLFDTIFINDKYIPENNKPYKYLYSEVVHEIIHTFQAHKYGGWIKAKLAIPYWVSEGYAVYMSRDDLAKNDENFIVSCSKKHFKNLTLPNIYILNGLMVKHAIEKMHKSVDELHLGKVDYDEVLDSMLREYNVTKE